MFVNRAFDGGHNLRSAATDQVMDPAPPTDREILLTGDAADFAVFFDRHAEWVLAFARRRSPDAESAADVPAEVIAAALAAAGATGGRAARRRPPPGPARRSGAMPRPLPPGRISTGPVTTASSSGPYPAPDEARASTGVGAVASFEEVPQLEHVAWPGPRSRFAANAMCGASRGRGDLRAGSRCSVSRGRPLTRVRSPPPTRSISPAVGSLGECRLTPHQRATGRPRPRAAPRPIRPRRRPGSRRSRPRTRRAARCARRSTSARPRPGSASAASPPTSAASASSCASRARTSRRSSPSRRPTARSGSATTSSESDADRILGDVEDFGRRQPWAVIAGGRRARDRRLALPQGVVEHAATSSALAGIRPAPGPHDLRRAAGDVGHRRRPGHAGAGRPRTPVTPAGGSDLEGSR